MEIRKGKYPECREILELYNNWEYEQAFRRLISIRSNLPLNVYAVCLFIMFTTDTDGEPTNLLIEAFNGVGREFLMYEEDLKKYENLPDTIHIFRGTENTNEMRPRLSWSLKKEVTLIYARAHLFETDIPKENIIAYFSKDTDEEEIVVDVGTRFKVIY